MYSLIFFLIQLISISGFNIPPNIINPLLSGSQLATAKISKNIVENLNLNSNTTRKIIHIASAPAFISTWGLYNDNHNPELWASSVPIVTSLYLINKKDELSSLISRSGNSTELFKGPLIYTSVLSTLTLTNWKDPVAMIALLQLSIGDGFADVIGRKFGKTKWIHNNKKSVEGTIGYFITSLIGTNLVINNYYHFDFNLEKIIIFSLISSLVETFSEIDDNISIPLSIFILDKILKI